MRILKTCFIALFLLTGAFSAFAESEITDVTFTPESLGIERLVKVYTPNGYDPEDATGYPLIIFLHGATVDPNSFTDSGDLQDALDLLIQFGTIPPSIVCIPDGSIEPFAGSFYTNSDMYGDFEDFIRIDLVTFMDESYNTVGDRANRAIMGHSMGGFGAMKIAFTYPETFAVVAAHSGPHTPELFADLVPNVIEENDPNDEGAPYTYDYEAGIFTELMFSMAGAFTPNVDSLEVPLIENRVDFILDDQAELVQPIFDQWLPHFAANKARANIDNIQYMPIYFDCGTEDELGIYPMNIAFRDTLLGLGLTERPRTTGDGNFYWDDYVGGHSDGLADRLPISFGFVGHAFNNPNGVDDVTISIPNQISLQPNWPNPFNAGTSISFDLNKTANVTLSVYDINGRLVTTLMQGQQSAGSKTLSWQPNASVASGVYFLNLNTEDASATRKIHLVK